MLFQKKSKTGSKERARKGRNTGSNEVINMPFGVNSEVGRLRQVMVHRQGWSMPA